MDTNNTKVSVTADSGANQKLLKELKHQGLITVTVVNLENGKQSKVSNKIGPVAVWGKFEWGDGSVWGNGEIYQQILRIVGGNSYQDARLLEAHYRSRNDVFVTGDIGDIFSKRDALFEKFGIRVVLSEGLKSLLAQETQ